MSYNGRQIYPPAARSKGIQRVRETAGLMLRICRHIFVSGKAVVLDSGFCVAKVITELKSKLIIISRYRGRSNPVVRHWEWAQCRHMRHRSLGHVLQKGDHESQQIAKYSIYNREERILDTLLSLFSLSCALKHYQRLYT